MIIYKFLLFVISFSYIDIASATNSPLRVEEEGYSKSAERKAFFIDLFKKAFKSMPNRVVDVRSNLHSTLGEIDFSLAEEIVRNFDDIGAATLVRKHLQNNILPYLHDKQHVKLLYALKKSCENSTDVKLVIDGVDFRKSICATFLIR